MRNNARGRHLDLQKNAILLKIQLFYYFRFSFANQQHPNFFNLITGRTAALHLLDDLLPLCFYIFTELFHLGRNVLVQLVGLQQKIELAIRSCLMVGGFYLDLFDQIVKAALEALEGLVQDFGDVPLGCVASYSWTGYSPSDHLNKCVQFVK